MASSGGIVLEEPIILCQCAIKTPLSGAPRLNPIVVIDLTLLECFWTLDYEAPEKMIYVVDLCLLLPSGFYSPVAD
jgi:hypothetical protein|tara:strand:- start:380 stop:607 length:228 start_codon:yes stop_codon:yes gene_type:complete